IGESTPKASAYNISSANAATAAATAAAASAAPTRYRLDYSSEAGYTPPPDDAERPRLRPLEPRTLKPIEPQPLYDENEDGDTTPGFAIRPDSAAPGPGPITTISEDDTEEEEPRLPSPTPKKM